MTPVTFEGADRIATTADGEEIPCRIVNGEFVTCWVTLGGETVWVRINAIDLVALTLQSDSPNL
jgi:hypothetical protein